MDPARLSFHAAAASDAVAVLRYAPIAGRLAARLGAYREAAEHYGRALDHATGAPAAQRAHRRLAPGMAKTTLPCLGAHAIGSCSLYSMSKVPTCPDPHPWARAYQLKDRADCRRRVVRRSAGGRRLPRMTRVTTAVAGSSKLGGG